MVDGIESLSHTICRICVEPFKDPMILPCLHSFCQLCLQDVVKKRHPQQYFPCPICKKYTAVPFGGAGAFPHNLHLEFEVEVAGYAAKVMARARGSSDSVVSCDLCIDEISGPAVVLCTTCCQFLCKICHDYHKRNRHTSKHNVVEMDEEGAKALPFIMKRNESQCFHHELDLSVYCETCKRFKCSQCMLDGHMGHKSSEISTAAKGYREDLKTALNGTLEVMQKLAGAIDEHEKMKEHVETSKAIGMYDIKQAFDTIMVTLEARKKKLLSEVSAKSQSKIKDLDLQKDLLKTVKEKLGNYSSKASHILNTHTDQEIFSLGRFVSTELIACTKKVEAMSLSVDQNCDIYASVKTGSLVLDLLKFGNILDRPPPQQEFKCTHQPRCLAVGGNGELFVGSDVNCIYVFDPNGQLQYTIGGGGSGNCQFNGVYGIAIKDDVLYVADCFNHRIQKLKCTGEFLLKFGQEGSGKGHFYQPSAVIVDSRSRVIVSDQLNHRVQVFNEDGGWLVTISGQGTGNHRFRHSWGLALDPNENLHIVDRGSNTIKVFTITGEYVRKYGHLKMPRGIAIDGEGYSIVSEECGNCISIFDCKGSKVHSVGDIMAPLCLALDPNDQDSVYVASYTDKTVLKYYYN